MSPPFEIPGYRVIRRLGIGGMATVYLAIQQSLKRPVAIKVLASENAPSDELVRRFENEARTIAQLDHPHIVSIFDVGRTSTGQIYYTMPYLPNGDLARRNLRDDPTRVLAIMRALAEALGCAHDQGIVHRDVKPENVLFDKLDRPLLADFGIALSGVHQPRLTREGATLGSSGYMSPEQARGQALDGRSDFYSLGVVCYELLTGEMPFRGSDALSVALAHIEKPVPRLPVTRRVWQPLIDKALAKQPDARFQSAEELLATLEVIEKRLGEPTRPGFSRWWLSAVEHTVAIPRRLRALAVCLILVLVLAGMLALLPRQAERAAMPDAPVAAAARAAATPNATLEAPTAGPPAEFVGPPAPGLEPSTADAAIAASTEAHKKHLRLATTLIAHDHLVTPEGDSAADQYLAILADKADDADALKGIRGILETLAARAGKSIVAGDASAALATIAQGRTLAEHAKLGNASPAFAAFVEPIHRAVQECRARKHDPFDTSALAALQPLLPILARIDPAEARALQTDMERPAKLLSDGGTFADAGGPRMAVITSAFAAAHQVDHPFAIAIDDVTREAYGRFVAARGRKSARCRESQNLFARSRGLDWRDPGFAQDGNHPVVCVSWDDANAYVQWLSQRTGAHYRLPNREEWLLLARLGGSGTVCASANIGSRSGAAAHCNDGYAQTAPVGRFAPTPPGIHDIAGNVSTWIDGCARPERNAKDCNTHAFRGLSWRDDDSKPNSGRVDTSAGDIGYVSVGFRVVRALPTDKAAH
jgi:serine/threonine-protein kinase PpkA